MADLLTNQTSSEAHMTSSSASLPDGSDWDLAWQTFLPPHYEDILAQAPDAPPNTSSKKEIHDYLCNRVLIQNGSQEFWLDRASQGVCQTIGARSLSIAWGDDTRYWDWRSQEGSRYPKVAYLKEVCWFDVRGELVCHLSPGTYTLSWRVFITQYMQGWEYSPVKFSFETTDATSKKKKKTTDGQRAHTEYCLSTNGREDRVFNDDGIEVQTCHRLGFNWVQNDWMEIEVGEFTVGAGDNLVGLKFSMSETVGGHWKGGLYLDCVMIQPTFRGETSTAGGNEEQGVGSDFANNSPPIVEMADLLKNHSGLKAHVPSSSASLPDGPDLDLPLWQTFLPPHHEDILPRTPDAPPSTSSKKEIHDYLCNRGLIQNGTQEFWLGGASQEVCPSIGAQSLSIAWGDDTRYWDWRSQAGSRYPKVAYLKEVCWFDVRGDLVCHLSPGTYTLSWRVFITQYMQGWEYSPVKFSFETTDATSKKKKKTTDGQRAHTEYRLSTNGREDRVFNDDGVEVQTCHRLGFNWVQNDWMEIEVGEFTVGAGDNLVGLKFSMSETVGGHWKGGLYLDCVIIQPTFRGETSTAGKNEEQGVGSDFTNNSSSSLQDYLSLHTTRASS